MPRIKFTDSNIRKLPAAETGTVWYTDTDLQGFQLAVGKRTRAFYVVKSLRNQQVRVKIGEWPFVPALGAREQARIVIGEISKGNDPRQQADDNEMLTVQDALDRYIAARTTGREKKKSITGGTAQNYRDLFKCHAPKWLRRDIRSITAAEVAEKHEKMGYHSAANKLVRVFHSLQRSVGIVPPPGFNFNVEKPRETGVKPDERAEFGQNILAVENISRRAAWLIGCYTGIRKNNLLALEWEHVDLRACTLFLPRMKNRLSRTMPLSSQAVAVLKSLVGLDPKWVFPSFDGSKSGHLIEVRDGAIPAHVCFHDTRHIFSEAGGDCLLPEYAIAYLRGDALSKSMAQQYMSRLSTERMRAPIQQIGDLIDEELFPKPRKGRKPAHRPIPKQPEIRMAA